MPRGYWVYSPGSSGVKIPEHIKDDIRNRILAVAEKHFKGKYTRIDIRFKNQFCYTQGMK
ncbi:MAG: hypothetical protein ABIG84_01695 [archaeon]